MSAKPSNVATSGLNTDLPPVTGSAPAVAAKLSAAIRPIAAPHAIKRFIGSSSRDRQTTKTPSSCSNSPSTSSRPPRRRSQTMSVWTALSLTPPDSG